MSFATDFRRDWGQILCLVCLVDVSFLFLLFFFFPFFLSCRKFLLLSFGNILNQWSIYKNFSLAKADSFPEFCLLKFHNMLTDKTVPVFMMPSASSKVGKFSSSASICPWYVPSELPTFQWNIGWVAWKGSSGFEWVTETTEIKWLKIQSKKFKAKLLHWACHLF